MLVTNAKLKMREEFEHKKKELQVQMLMCVAALLWRSYSVVFFSVASRVHATFSIWTVIRLYVCLFALQQDVQERW